MSLMDLNVSNLFLVQRILPLSLFFQFPLTFPLITTLFSLTRFPEHHTSSNASFSQYRSTLPQTPFLTSEPILVLPQWFPYFVGSFFPFFHPSSLYYRLHPSLASLLPFSTSSTVFPFLQQLPTLPSPSSPSHISHSFPSSFTSFRPAHSFSLNPQLFCTRLTCSHTSSHTSHLFPYPSYAFTPMSPFL